MTTKAIKRKRRDDEPLRHDLQAPEERAPSIVRQDQITPSRIIAMMALIPTAVGALALIMAAGGRTLVVGPGLGFFLLMLGLAGLLFHAVNEKELVYRRMYGIAAGVLLFCGVLFSLLKAYGTVGGLFLAIGTPCIVLALCFGFSFIRNETDSLFRQIAIFVIGLAGALMVLVGLIGGLVSEYFLMSRGIVYLVLAFLYIVAFVGMQSASSKEGYWAGFALGAVGVVMMIVALGKSLPFENIPGIGFYLTWINDLFAWVPWSSGQPGAPFLFTYIGLEFLLLAIGICSDNQLVAMTRRELVAYFYSPIAYVVLVALVIAAGVNFAFFYLNLVAEMAQPASRFAPPSQGVLEPIVTGYFFNLFTVISVILVVPIFTMRLLSEESRSGTLEVLLTAPVKESTVVISKFLAAWRFYLLTWYPVLLYLIALRVEGGEQFDYRPVLSFIIVIAITGAGFIGMGVFCSTLTSNQIASAVLCFVGMLALTAFWLINLILRYIGSENAFWNTILPYISYLDVWRQASSGLLAPRYLLFHISAAVFFLFLSVKVLESRKWK